ncbi:MAG: hypothetical protein ACREDH_08100 [Methylocella sp.]
MLTPFFAAALIAASAHANAAPRSIDDCEQIQAADAYNRCLALFGPIARGHGAAGDGLDADRQDAEAATGNAHTEVATAGESHHARHHAKRHGWTRHSWVRHGWARRSWARRGHWHRTGTAGRRHGRATKMAFSVVSGSALLR